MINLRVETLIQPGRCQLIYARSQNWCSKQATVVSLHNVTLATAHSRRLPQKTEKKKTLNADEIGPGERTREGEHHLKV